MAWIQLSAPRPQSACRASVNICTSRAASVKNQGSEHIARADALITVRVAGRHGASARYIWSRRAASGPGPGQPDIIQSRGSFGLFYTYTHGTKFGVVTF